MPRKIKQDLFSWPGINCCPFVMAKIPFLNRQELFYNGFVCTRVCKTKEPTHKTRMGFLFIKSGFTHTHKVEKGGPGRRTRARAKTRARVKGASRQVRAAYCTINTNTHHPPHSHTQIMGLAGQRKVPSVFRC